MPLVLRPEAKASRRARTACQQGSLLTAPRMAWACVRNGTIGETWLRVTGISRDYRHLPVRSNPLTISAAASIEGMTHERTHLHL